jgi:hypothetical protein
MFGFVSAQSPDSLILTNSEAGPGDTTVIQLLLRNTQFSVGGFSSRFVLEDYQNAAFSHVERGEAVADFEMFFANVTDSVCRVNGIADMPLGNIIPPLPLGLHELGKIYIVVDSAAPNNIVDSIVFENDSLPPIYDSAISDSSGWISEVPTLINGSVTFQSTVGVIDNPVIIPSSIELSQNYPNPFNAETTIEFSLTRISYAVSLIIYDILGNCIKEFYWDFLGPGSYYVRWNGMSEDGYNHSSGVYFFRLADDTGQSQTRKMTLLK